MGLDVEAQARYAFLLGLLEQRLDPPARLVELGAAPGDQIATLADRGYDTTAVDIGVASDEWADGTEGRMAALFADHGVRYVEWDLEQVPRQLAHPAAWAHGLLAAAGLDRRRAPRAARARVPLRRGRRGHAHRRARRRRPDQPALPPHRRVGAQAAGQARDQPDGPTAAHARPPDHRGDPQA